jgi:hypothetical protein
MPGIGALESQVGFFDAIWPMIFSHGTDPVTG